MRFKPCEDCLHKQATWGLNEDMIKRWCVKCAHQGHDDAIDLVTKKKCEDCMGKNANFGLPDEGEFRAAWKHTHTHAHTAHTHAHAQVRRRPLRQLSRVWVGAGTRRWCLGCSKAHGKSISLNHKPCIDCGMR